MRWRGCCRAGWCDGVAAAAVRRRGHLAGSASLLWPGVIGQVLPRGGSVRGLLYYLFTEGRAGEKGLASAHLDARVIASWDGRPEALQPPLCAGGQRDFTDLVSRLNEPVALLGWRTGRRRAATRSTC